MDDAHVSPTTGLICIKKGKEPRSLEVAEAYARYWMERYSEYVRSGVFEDGGGRATVPDR
jgi:hypothetical protein